MAILDNKKWLKGQNIMMIFYIEFIMKEVFHKKNISFCSWSDILPYISLHLSQSAIFGIDCFHLVKLFCSGEIWQKRVKHQQITYIQYHKLIYFLEKKENDLFGEVAINHLWGWFPLKALARWVLDCHAENQSLLQLFLLKFLIVANLLMS